MSGLTVSKIWETSLVKHATENYFHRHTAKGQPKKLEEPELDSLQLLIKSRPSVTYMAKLDTSRWCKDLRAWPRRK